MGVSTPLMIFPSSNKYSQSYTKPYFELFTKFQDYLRQPNTLLITVGFSFQDNHIANMVNQAILKNDELSVLITDFNIEQKHENWQMLEERMGEFYSVSFLSATLNDNLSTFLGGEIVED